jgi:putative hydrolase of the HAD superfamily
VAVNDDLLALWFDAESRHMLDWQEGLVTFGEQRRQRLREVLVRIHHEPVGDDQLDGMFASYLALYEAAWTLFPDVEDCLDGLEQAAIAVAVLSNGVEQQQRAKLAAVGLSERIADLFTSEAMGFAKPDPRAFTTPCERLGLRVDQVLHVGDRYDVDVVAARAAGLEAVHLDRNSTRPGDAYTIRGLGQLKALVA